MPVPTPDTIMTPGRGLEPPADDDSWITTALTRPHRLLQALRGRRFRSSLTGWGVS